MPSSRGLLFGVAVMLAVAIGLQVVRDRAWVPFQPTVPAMWLHASPLARKLALGYDTLLADIYWIRAVVYYGGVRLVEDHSARNYEQLYPLLDMVTTLDPDFKVAYRFGAIYLTEAYPNGPGRPDQAMDLLQRALVRHPDGWEYMHDLAFIYYWWLDDNRMAASWFNKAAALPGAPEWLAPLAATTLAEGGDRNLSRQMWRQMREESEVEWIRRSAEQRLRQLDAMDGIDSVKAIVARFTTETGRPPRDWTELVAVRLLPGVPLDPAGVPLVLDSATGEIDVDVKSPLWPLPVKRRRGPE